jgi:response regulator of citrate/malate metabolism
MGEKVDVKPLYIGDSEFVELSELLQQCAESVRSGFKEYLLKAFSIDTIAHLEKKEYQKIKDMLTVRASEHQKMLVEAEIADTPEARKEGKKK